MTIAGVLLRLVRWRIRFQRNMKNNLPNRVVMVEIRLGRLGIESEESSGRGL